MSRHTLQPFDSDWLGSSQSGWVNAHYEYIEQIYSSFYREVYNTFGKDVANTRIGIREFAAYLESVVTTQD